MLNFSLNKLYNFPPKFTMFPEKCQILKFNLKFLHMTKVYFGSLMHTVSSPSIYYSIPYPLKIPFTLEILTKVNNISRVHALRHVKRQIQIQIQIQVQRQIQFNAFSLRRTGGVPQSQLRNKSHIHSGRSRPKLCFVAF